MKIKKGDTVLIIAGRDRGKKGKILKVLQGEGRVMVEGINLIKKRKRPRKSGEKGQTVEIPASLNESNVQFLCQKCGKPTRIGHKILEGKKYRICKKCGQET